LCVKKLVVVTPVRLKPKPPREESDPVPDPHPEDQR
jgi:hypothetical protein